MLSSWRWWCPKRFWTTWKWIEKWFRRVWPDEMDGKYSIARLKAFDDYRARHSKCWMSLVVLLTPLPSACVVIALNFFPLVDPKLGWKPNYMFFIRAFVEALICTQASRSQRQFFFADAKTRIQFDWGFRLALGFIMVGAYLALAAWVQFPMPFGIFIALLIGSPMMFVVGRYMVRKLQRTLTQLSRKSFRYTSAATSVRSTLRTRSSKNFFSTTHSTLHDDPQLFFQSLATNDRDDNPNTLTTTTTTTTTTNQQGTRAPVVDPVATNAMTKQFDNLVGSYTRIMMFQVLVIFVYPIFQVGYNLLDGRNQVLYFLTQPALRKVLSVVYRKQCTMTPDLVNEMLLFSVRLMAVLFRAIFFGTSSWGPLALLIAWDLMDLVYCFARMGQQYDAIQTIMKQMGHHRKAMGPIARDFVHESVAFIDEHKSILLTQSAMLNLRWIGSNGMSLYKPSGVSSLFSKNSQTPKRRRSTTIYVGSINTSLEKSIESHKQLHQKQLLLLEKTMSLLSLLEYIVLGEYGEAIVPYFYAVYLVLSGLSPCHRFLRTILYYEQMGHALSQVVTSLLLYATIELGSLLVLWVATKWRLGFDLVEVLAFVLETHFIDVQAKMVFFLVLVLDFNLLHYGGSGLFPFVLVLNERT